MQIIKIANALCLDICLRVDGEPSKSSVTCVSVRLFLAHASSKEF